MPNQPIKCHYCSRVPLEFTILICDHVMCSDCLWSESQQSGRIDTVNCSCGIKTYFNRLETQSNLSQAQSRSSSKMNRNSTKKAEIMYSPKGYSRCLRTDTGTESTFERSKGAMESRVTVEQEPIERLSKQLTNEMHFLEMRFSKAVQEASNNYRKLMSNLTVNFESLVRKIKFFYLEQIVDSQSHSFGSIAKLVQEKYEQHLGRHITKLNDSITSRIEKLTSDSQETRFATQHVRSSQRNTQHATLHNTEATKENTKAPNCRYYKDREKLIAYISELKEESRRKSKGFKAKVL